MQDVICKRGPIELRLGRWQDVLADVAQCDAVIVDGPYGSKTHDGHAGRTRTDIRDKHKLPEPLPYDGWTPADVGELCLRWSGAAMGWFVAATSHDLFADYAARLGSLGRYVFAPVPIVTPGMSIRLRGDGPSSWTVWLCVARPPSLSRWGTLPGAYIGKPADSVIAGGKNLATMRAIVRDYSRPGDLIVDPCAGGATTLIAAAIEGRRAIGAEMDPETFRKACRRIDGGWTPDLFNGEVASETI